MKAFERIRRAETYETDSTTRRIALGVAICGIFIGSVISIEAIPRLHLYGDEFHSLRDIELPPLILMERFGQNGSGSALRVLQHWGLSIFGPTLWAVRWPAALGCVATLLLMIPAGTRFVGRVPAALATLALALNPMHIFYSRFGRTYALVMLLALGYTYVLDIATGRNEPRRLVYALVALSGGLLVFVHLSAAGFALLMGLAALAKLAADGRLRTRGGLLVLHLVAGAALSGVLYLPAVPSLLSFIEVKAGMGFLSLGSIRGIATVVSGGPALGLVWLLVVPAAIVCLLAARGVRSSLVAVAPMAAVPALVLADPVGNEWAFARYLLPGLPILLMVFSWFLVALGRSVGLSLRQCLVAGVVVVLLSWAPGPFGLWRTDDGRFSGSYLGLTPLPAFDVAWPDTPEFYRQLAEEPESVRIIEAPELWDQSRALYRNYFLQHRKDVVMGFVGVRLPGEFRDPIINARRKIPLGVDYLILHRNLEVELRAYWQFMYAGDWQSRIDSGRLPFMQSYMARRISQPVYLKDIEQVWLGRFGEPVYRDRYISVWKLGPGIKDSTARRPDYLVPSPDESPELP